MSFNERPKMPQSEVPNGYFAVDMSDWTQEDNDAFRTRIDEQDRAATEQTNAEKTYLFDSPTLSSDTEATVEQVVSMLELGHVVKEAPRFEAQINDETRTNTIVCVTGQEEYIGTVGFEEKYNEKRIEMSEHDALKMTYQFFQAMAAAEARQDEDYYESHPEDVRPDEAIYTLGDDMRDNLTYIGDKELNEASGGLAEYWKAILDTNPNQQILVPVGTFVRSQAYGTPQYATRVKSDKYVFDKVMDHFTDEEKALYQGRLITDPSEVQVTDPSDLRIILLDDWSISRKQMSDTASQIRRELPLFASCVEVNMIVATDEQIQRGLARVRNDAAPGTKSAPLPVRAYYKAHVSSINERSVGIKAHITGSHSAVDYNFGELLERERRSLVAREEDAGREAPDELRSQPPVVNIVRPYRPVGSPEDNLNTSAFDFSNFEDRFM